jgi:predicted ATPase
MSYKLKLSKFNPLILEKKRRNGHAPIMLFVGKRGSGKTTLVEDMLYHMKGIRAFMCMSGTEEGNGFYSKHIHPLCIHNSFNESALADLLKH